MVFRLNFFKAFFSKSDLSDNQIDSSVVDDPYNEIIPYVKKLFSPRYGSYFIIRVNKHKNDLNFFDVLNFLRDKIPESAKITWTLCNKLKQMNKSRKSNNTDVELILWQKFFL